MKLKTLLFASALIATAGLGSATQAAMITGQVSLSGIAIDSAPTNNVATATSFVLAIDTVSPANQLRLSGSTGTFAPIADGTPVDVTTGLFTTSDPYIVLSLAGGSFTGEVLATDSGVGNFRLIEILGTINAVGFDPTAARLLLAFTQAGGPGGSISVSGTIVAAAVPEPGSIAMAGMGILALGGLALRRRARANA